MYVIGKVTEAGAGDQGIGKVTEAGAGDQGIGKVIEDVCR